MTMHAPVIPVKKVPKPLSKSPASIVRQALATDAVNIYKALVADELHAGVERQHNQAERIGHILGVITSGYAVVVETSGRILGGLGFFGARTQGDDKATLVCNSGVGFCFFAENIGAEMLTKSLQMCTRFADSHDVAMILNVQLDGVMEQFLAHSGQDAQGHALQGFFDTHIEYYRLAASDDEARTDSDPEFDDIDTMDGKDPTTDKRDLSAANVERVARQVVADADDEIITDADAEQTVRQYARQLETQANVKPLSADSPVVAAVVALPAPAKRKPKAKTGSVHGAGGPAKRDDVGK